MIVDSDVKSVLAALQTVSAATILPGISLPAWALDGAVMVLDLRAVSAGGTSTFSVEMAASTTSGTWIRCGGIDIPASTPACLVPVGVVAGRWHPTVPKPGALRLNISQTAPTTITFEAWLTKAYDNLALGVAGKDHITVPAAVGMPAPGLVVASHSTRARR